MMERLGLSRQLFSNMARISELSLQPKIWNPSFPSYCSIHRRFITTTFKSSCKAQETGSGSPPEEQLTIEAPLSVRLPLYDYPVNPGYPATPRDTVYTKFRREYEFEMNRILSLYKKLYQERIEAISLIKKEKKERIERRRAVRVAKMLEEIQELRLLKKKAQVIQIKETQEDVERRRKIFEEVKALKLERARQLVEAAHDSPVVRPEDLDKVISDAIENRKDYNSILEPVGGKSHKS
eukprot:Sdes_comp9650_c0_seq1m1148